VNPRLRGDNDVTTADIAFDGRFYAASPSSQMHIHIPLKVTP
jgi:hypothetical protein